MNIAAGALRKSTVNETISQPEPKGKLLKATVVKKVVEKYQAPVTTPVEEPKKKVVKKKTKVKELKGDKDA